MKRKITLAREAQLVERNSEDGDMRITASNVQGNINKYFKLGVL
jgi:hypothetical protein